MNFKLDTLFTDRDSSFVKRGNSLIDFGGRSGASYIAGNIGSTDELITRAYKLSRARMKNLSIENKSSLIFTKRENSTNGRIINVSTDVLDDEKISTEERLNVLYGEVTHESAHVMYTPFVKVKSLCSIHHTLINILEDERIERKIVDEYVGYADCLGSIKDHFFSRLYICPFETLDEITKTDGMTTDRFFKEMDNPITNMVNLILLIVRYPKHVDNLLKFHKQINEQNYELYELFLTDAIKLMKPYPKSFKATNDLATEIYNLIKVYYLKFLKNSDSGSKQGVDNKDTLKGKKGSKSGGKSTLKGNNSNESSKGEANSADGKFPNHYDDLDIEGTFREIIADVFLDKLRKDCQKKLDKLANKSKEEQDRKAEKIQEEYINKRDEITNKIVNEIRSAQNDSERKNETLNSSTAKGGGRYSKGVKTIAISKNIKGKIRDGLAKMENGEHDWKDSKAGTLGSTKSMEVSESEWIDTDNFVDEYRQIKKDNKYNVKRLGNALRIQMTNYGEIIKSQRNGKLDKLVDGFIGDEHVYTKKVEGTKEKLSICLLIDESGSMGGRLDDGIQKYRTARNISVMFNEALKRVDDIELFIYGFDSDREDNLYIYKEPKTTKSDINLMRIKARGGNADYIAIQDSTKKVRSFTDSKCLLVVLSDGLPCHHTGNYNYIGKHHNPIDETKTIVEQIKKKGFVPFQIGIGTHYEKNPMFSDWVQFQDYTQMTTDVVKLIRRRIAKMLKV